MVFYLFLENNSKKKMQLHHTIIAKKKTKLIQWRCIVFFSMHWFITPKAIIRNWVQAIIFLGYSKEIYVLIWRINKNNIKSLIYRPLCFNWYSNVAIMAAAEISNKTRARTIGHLLLFDSLISGIMTLSDLMIYWKKTSNHVCSFTVLLTYDIFKNTFTWQPLVL